MLRKSLQVSPSMVILFTQGVFLSGSRWRNPSAVYRQRPTVQRWVKCRFEFPGVHLVSHIGRYFIFVTPATESVPFCPAEASFVTCSTSFSRGNVREEGQHECHLYSGIFIIRRHLLRPSPCYFVLARNGVVRGEPYHHLFGI